ncbi:MAG TPA: 3,4-dihydroxy-2-butanone-4-phosphate synthase [Solirubrobacterales bacterium]|nr:3,4-dihydroxy-2-butanone-4-phosphate synthase [Solirubrobacterales bacterium]
MARLDLVRSATPAPSAFARAVADLAAGRMVVLRDGPGRDGEGDLLVAAELATAEAVNLMVREARGLVFLALTAERCDQLGLQPIGRRGRSRLGDASMVSIEAKEGVSTGISAADRARTIAVAVDPEAGPEDIVQPGHVFPMRARPGGVLERDGRTEAAVDLATAAGLHPAGVLCQVMREDGRTARDEDLELFAAERGLAVVSVADVIGQRRGTQPVPAALDQRRQMRDVMGHFATGVSVVTTRRPDGAPLGTTANAITSVSLEPPLLLACLSSRSETLIAIRDSGRFAVNVLASDQRHHSDRFAAKGEDAAPHEVEFDDHPLGVPVLPGALATIACEVEAIHRAGDHEIVVGHARSLAHVGPGGGEPLLFFRGGYSQLGAGENDLAA